MATSTDGDMIEFRQRVATWLAANTAVRTETAVPPEPMVSDKATGNLEERRARARSLYDAGLAGITWPTEYGGAGLGPIEEAVFAQESLGYDLGLGVFTVALSLVGPTLLAHGTQAQKDLHLDRILRGEEIWCQLFSEPGAGSDLASVRTKAELVGDEWVVNGQKVWTSGAHHSDFGILVARTDFSVPKHKGLTYFVVDMTTPGITMRPLRQMTGDAHFAEVFLDDVRLPRDSVVGEVGQGWAVVRTTLSNERVSIGNDPGVSGDMLVGLARSHQRSVDGPIADAAVRDAVAGLVVRERVLQALASKGMQAAVEGRPPGPEGSIFKLENATYQKAANDLAMRLLGADGLLAGSDAPFDGAWQMNFLMAPYLRIAGGTDEIQRNIIAERILGLPVEKDENRNKPFSEVSKV